MLSLKDLTQLLPFSHLLIQLKIYLLNKKNVKPIKNGYFLRKNKRFNTKLV